MKLYIKNMVCERCIAAVEEVLRQQGLIFRGVSLGKADLYTQLSDERIAELNRALQARGFELLSDRRRQIVSQIKTIVLRHFAEASPRSVNFSDLLATELHYDYAYLSRLFSRTEGRTIEQFITAHRMERAKELLSYGELTISEIADCLHYGSLSRFSTHFRKAVGRSPSDYQRQTKTDRKPLDEV